MMKQLIAEIFYQHPTKSFTKNQLRKALKIDDSENELFLKALKELKKDGILFVPKKGAIHAIHPNEWKIGKLCMNNKGYGFVVNRKEKMAIYIPHGKLFDAIHKDTVIVRITKKGGQLKHPEGEIISVLSHEITALVGTYQLMDDYGFVIPDDSRFLQEIYIPNDVALQAQPNEKVVVRITEYQKRGRNPVGEIIERLGIKGDKDAELLSVLKEHNIPCEFPLEVLNEAKNMETTIPEYEKERRADYTGKTIFTIDGEDAKDLDDAISIERKENGNYVLGVHIADVSHYVQENSHIDREALKRGTSVYLIDHVVPMLPKELSNGLCSLNPNEEKLAISVIMEIDQKGNVKKSSFYESVIQSDARLTYQEVTDYLNRKNSSFEEKYPFLVDEIKWLKELTLILQKRREKRGSIDFDFDECVILLDSDGKVMDVKAYERGIANKMIEECMLVCNETVAEYFAKRDIPFVYRIHSEPIEEKMETLFNYMEFLEHPLDWGETIESKNFQSLLNETKEWKEGKAIQLLLLHSMMQARYSPECKGHFGLATPYYTHFTSPIRRYPDLQIHRILKEYLHHAIDSKRKEQLKEIVQKSSEISSRRERIAEQAEEEYKQLKKMEWMEAKVEEEFDGIVTDVTEKYLIVTLDNTIEGKISIDSVKKHGYMYSPNLMAWVNEIGGVYLGDSIRVKVKRVSMEEREIYFDIVKLKTK